MYFYTHVADMYPWDKVARTNEDILAMPSWNNQVWSIDPQAWKNTFLKEEMARKLFKYPEKMEEVIVQLTDLNRNNDELSWVNITKSGIEYRIITPDTIFAP